MIELKFKEIILFKESIIYWNKKNNITWELIIQMRKILKNLKLSWVNGKGNLIKDKNFGEKEWLIKWNLEKNYNDKFKKLNRMNKRLENILIKNKYSKLRFSKNINNLVRKDKRNYLNLLNRPICIDKVLKIIKKLRS